MNNISDEQSLLDHVELWNEYNDDKPMELVELAPEFYALYIDDRHITEDDTYNMLRRVKQINRENCLY